MLAGSSGGSGARLGLRAEPLRFRAYRLLRLTLWDVAEARCLSKLQEMCAPLGTGHACSLCALEHLAVLKSAGCATDTNWANVVTFWCGCLPGGLGDNSCGGPPPPL